MMLCTTLGKRWLLMTVIWLARTRNLISLFLGLGRGHRVLTIPEIVWKRAGPSADPDANQAHSWLGRRQADRASDPDWETPTLDETEHEISWREGAVEKARQESGYYRDEQDIDDADRRQAITDRWDTEGYQDDVDYKAEYEQSPSTEEK